MPRSGRQEQRHGARFESWQATAFLLTFRIFTFTFGPRISIPKEHQGSLPKCMLGDAWDWRSSSYVKTPSTGGGLEGPASLGKKEERH